MKRFRYASVLVLLMLAHYAHGDSVSTFVAQATIAFGPSPGGDNMLATFGGAGVNLNASGDMSCAPSVFWCDSFAPTLTPGSSLKPTAFLSFTYVEGRVTLGGRSRICSVDCGLFGTEIAALGSFQFPINGRDFTVTVPATISPVFMGVQVMGQLGDQRFALQVPQGRLTLTFHFEAPVGQNAPPPYYQFESGFFTTTPEPGTLILMGSGLAGIVGAVLKKRRSKENYK